MWPFSNFKKLSELAQKANVTAERLEREIDLLTGEEGPLAELDIKVTSLGLDADQMLNALDKSIEAMSKIRIIVDEISIIKDLLMRKGVLVTSEFNSAHMALRQLRCGEGADPPIPNSPTIPTLNGMI